MRIEIITGLLLCTMSCIVPGKPPVVTPPTVPTAHEENMTALPGALGVITPDSGTPYSATADVNGRLVFTINPDSTGGAWLTVTLPHYLPSQTRYVFCQVTCEQPIVVLTPALPPIPTRAQVTAVKLTFQGLTVCTHKFGCLPWFEPAILALDDPLDRQAVYEAKHTQGDTHLIVQFGHGGLIYGEPPHYQNVCCSPDWEAHPSLFLNLVEEIIQNGFIPVITYDGDCGDDPVCGSPNAARQAPILASLFKGSTLGDLNPYVLYFRGWDSVFYGSSPTNIQSFGKLFRSILPNGYLAIEFNTGHIPLGNGPSDYAPGGMMTDYDVIMAEFDNWPTVGGAEWEVLARMLGPAYIPDPNQPGDSAPFYLKTGSPRGPYTFSCFEWGEYGWTHDQLSAAEYGKGYAWYKARGCPNY